MIGMAGSGVPHHSLDRPGIALASRHLPDCGPPSPGALQTGAERLIRSITERRVRHQAIESRQLYEAAVQSGECVLLEM